MANGTGLVGNVDDRFRIRVHGRVMRPRQLPSRNGRGYGGDSGREPADATGVEIAIDDNELQRLVEEQKANLTVVFHTLERLSEDLKTHAPKVPQVLPPQVRGTLLQPSGEPAGRISVEVLAPIYTHEELATFRRNSNDSVAVAWPTPRTITDNRGSFALNLPTVPIPREGLQLRIQGAMQNVTVPVRAVDLEAGKLGIIPLPVTITPLPQSIVASVRDLIPASAEEVEENPDEFAAPAPSLSLGEGDCAKFFRSNSGVIDRFRYSVLIRLVEPRLSTKQLVLQWAEANNLFSPLPVPNAHQPFPWLKGLLATTDITKLQDKVLNGQVSKWTFKNRIPVDRPIDVADFHSAVEETPLQVPKAGTLGLGYILKLHQVWIPTGLSLGDLVYSLPLAPGEEQRIAVREHSETLSVREQEGLTFDEAQSFQQTEDSSTQAVFESAADEAVKGGSETSATSITLSSSKSEGSAGLNPFPGVNSSGSSSSVGTSSSTGNTNSWQNTSKDFVSSASQDLHAAVARQAQLRRRATRTSVRLASSSEQEQVTTKVIANHNHCHALTIQYWEVLRHFAVSSLVDDVQLVCYVPLELIPFLPEDQPLQLPSAATFDREDLLDRYAMLLRYHDVLAWRLRHNPQYRYGLQVLKNFAANPQAQIKSQADPSQDVIVFSVEGPFLPFETLYVRLVTQNNQVVGPVKLAGTPIIVPGDQQSHEQLISTLRELRNGTVAKTYMASLALPMHTARSQIARFELSRQVQPYTYTGTFNTVEPVPTNIGGQVLPVFETVTRTMTTTVTVTELDRLVGEPNVHDILAKLQNDSVTLADQKSTVPLADSLPIAALGVAPTLSYADLLSIEAVFQHVVRNTVTYSKAVWQSLTPEERAILLERFTIGVPAGGVQDESQEVPLLNCVANQVLGYFGNAMVMPFHIPPSLAAKLETTTRDIQEVLLRFHRPSNDNYTYLLTTITCAHDGA